VQTVKADEIYLHHKNGHRVPVSVTCKPGETRKEPSSGRWKSSTRFYPAPPWRGKSPGSSSWRSWIP
jgi:hypothetical protein